MRKNDISRRTFLKKKAVLGLSFGLGAPIFFSELLAKELKPLIAIEDIQFYNLPGKDPGLVILNDRPINAETPAHLLNDAITPADKFFVRNNGIPPNLEEVKDEEWKLTIEGESVNEKKIYTILDLKSNFQTKEFNLTLECGGNGRSEFNPPAKGNQWSTGAVACSKWTGVSLKDVLRDVGIKDNAVYIAYYGKDTHLSGDPNKEVISRGVPIQKALQEESLIAWALNDQRIPLLNGYPLRLVFGGWPASCSGKWLSKIVVRDKIHDGKKMGGQSYRVPCKPVAPGSKVDDKDMCIIESMPVKSLITYPKSGAIIKKARTLKINGHAWAGEQEVTKVEYSIDFGSTWQSCQLTKPLNRFAWQQFEAEIDFPGTGYFEVWSKATDENGKAQPMVLPAWNPRGYLNNACHRVAIKVTS